MIRINLPTKLCRFRIGFVVSDKRLSFPTKLCRFRQALLVSDKALSFPTSALSEIREFRNLITPVTARRVSCPPVTLRNDKKIGLHAHRQGQLPDTICSRSYKEHSFRPDLPISEGFSE